MIPFAPFEPSRSKFNPQASSVALNVLPKADGWGPMPDLVPYGEPVAFDPILNGQIGLGLDFISGRYVENTTVLDGKVIGAAYVRDASGAVTLFAGTRTSLFRFETTDRTWVDVSRTTGGDYAVPDGDNWCFTVYGRRLIATNLSDVPQYLDVGVSSRFAALPGSPPRAKYCFVAGDFLALGHLLSVPEGVRWSGLNDSEFWTIGERGADQQLFPDGNEVQGAFTVDGGAIVIQRNAIRFMQFAPASGYTFTFRTLNAARGAVSPLSIAQIGPGRFVYLSEDGFFMGSDGQPIGAERVDDWFLQGELNLDDLSIVQAVTDPYEKIVWWQYRRNDNTRRLLGYNWQLDRWCTSDVNVSFLVSALTPGISWDALDQLYPSIDAVSEPFDSRLFKGGRPNFSAFTTDNRLAYFTGTAMKAVADTATVQLGPDRTFVNGVRPTFDGSAITIDVGTLDAHGTPTSWKGPNSPNATGLVPARANGRLHRFQAEIPAGTSWTHLHGVDPSIRAGGRR